MRGSWSANTRRGRLIILAQLTDGDLVRLVLVGEGRQACVVNREGATIAVEHLERCAARSGLLELVPDAALGGEPARVSGCRWCLDEPFERLDARATAALVAVLDVFCRQGHQVIVFTRKQDATERLASVGAAVHNIASLRRWRVGTAAGCAAPRTSQTAVTTSRFGQAKEAEDESTDVLTSGVLTYARRDERRSRPIVNARRWRQRTQRS